MGQDKNKQLTKLLASVKVLYDNPDNKEFAAGIESIVISDKDFMERYREATATGDPGALQKIESYLSLDFKIDSELLEDYSFITDEGVRRQLLTDYREMLRYQFGTRSHKVDFLEFCRYAHLQTEMLINYYLETVFKGDFTAMVNAMREAYPDFKVSDQASSASDIYLKSRLYFIGGVLDLPKKDVTAFIHVYEVRNRQSHRSLRLNRDIIAEIGEKLKDPQLKKKDGNIDYDKANKVIGKDRMGEYWFQTWFDRQPFAEVTANLRRLSDAIRNDIG